MDDFDINFLKMIGTRPRGVLVTGATGFLGRAVARRLHQLGVEVVATGRNSVAIYDVTSEPQSEQELL